jgi:hypothetical protein
MRSVVLVLVAVLSLGAKPSAQSAYIVLNQSNPQLGDVITFTYAPTTLPGPAKSQPRIQVICYQGPDVVYAEANWASASFLLGGFSSAWLNSFPGPVHCMADLFYFSYHGGQAFNLLASTQFDATDPRVP